MKGAGKLAGRGGLLLGAFWLLAAPGCVHFEEAPAVYPHDFLQPESVPSVCRNSTYIFLVQAADPLDVGGVEEVREHLLDRGFLKVYHGCPHHYFFFAKEIRRLHATRPQARFVLVGHRVGANVAHGIARAVAADGITVDLLVYLDPVLLEAEACRPPGNVLRTVNLVPRTHDGKPLLVEGADNYEHDKVGTLHLPTHPDTLHTLVREVAEVASRVEIVTVGSPGRGVVIPEGADPAWGFLTPQPVGPDLGRHIPLGSAN